MTKLSKKQKIAHEKISQDTKYNLSDAIALLKEFANAKFVESADISVNLGVNISKSDEVVRGSVVLPHGNGKTVKVAVFTQGDNADKALEAGADTVGMEDLSKAMQDGDTDYDVIIASPDAMGVVGKLGQLLGPKGLMPNPKVGTVTADVATAVKNAKFGQVRYRADKGGIVHASIGNISLEDNKLIDNINALLDALKKSKPDVSKGVYFKKISIASTMGAGININIATTSVG